MSTGNLFISLRVRNYRLFASGQVVSLTGTWMQRVAQDWLVITDLHGTGSQLGIVTGLQFLPTLLGSLWGGVLADRYPKRRLLLITQSFSAVLALALGLLDLTGVVQIWHVYVLAFLLGTATMVDTPTRQAFVSELVGRDRVSNAVSLNSATFNTARVLGPAIAGVLIGPLGTGVMFLANAASFVAVISVLLLLRESELYVSTRAPRRPGQLREGLHYVRRRPELLLPIILVAVIGTLGLNFQLTMALMAKQVFHRTASGYGLLSTMLAGGSLIGALIAARRPRIRMRLMYGAALAFGVLEAVTAFVPEYWLFAALLLPTGAAVLTFTTAANSTVQMGAAPSMRGRVMALYVLVFLGGTPFGAPLVGWLAEVLGPRSSLWVGGFATIAATLAVVLTMLRIRQLRVKAHLIRRHPHVHFVPRAPVGTPEYDDIRAAV